MSAPRITNIYSIEMTRTDPTNLGFESGADVYIALLRLSGACREHNVISLLAKETNTSKRSGNNADDADDADGTRDDHNDDDQNPPFVLVS